MPLFEPIPAPVEAHQWRGNLAELPLAFAAVVVPRGCRDAEARTGAGPVPLPVLSWLVRHDGRFDVYPDGVFQRRYAPASSEAPAPPRKAKPNG